MGKGKKGEKEEKEKKQMLLVEENRRWT